MPLKPGLGRTLIVAATEHGQEAQSGQNEDGQDSEQPQCRPLVLLPSPPVDHARSRVPDRADLVGGSLGRALFGSFGLAQRGT